MSDSGPDGSAARYAQPETAAPRVTLAVDDGIASVQLNRPAKHNGLDLPMLRALVELARQVARDPEIRVVIMSGAGTSFCAGLDFAAVGKEGPLQLARAALKVPGQSTNLFQRACWAWRQVPVPVIAVLHGNCFGGGMQLALAADFRFAAPDCSLSVMEGKWGLIPDMSGSITLRELVGMDVAKRLTMTAEIVDAEQAQRYGLVSEVSDDPMAAALRLAAELQERSPDALALTKRLFHRTWTASPRRAMWIETVLQARLLRGANHRIARTFHLGGTAEAGESPAFVSRQVR